MGMLDSRAAPRKGMLDPAALRRMAELQALMGADPSGTGMVQAPPGPSNPSFDAWSAANPVPLAYTGMPPGGPPPSPMVPQGAPGMPPPGGMGMPPQTMQMDQGMQPPGQMPPMQQPEPQVAPGAPGEAASADPFFQALAGMSPTLGGCGSQPDLLPNAASFPSSPNVPRGTPPKRRAAAQAGSSESDQLNAQMLAMILARKGRA